MRRALIIVAILGLGCQPSAPTDPQPTPEDPTPKEITDFGIFRDAVLDSLEINIVLLNGDDTVYSHGESSDGMTRRTASDDLPWYEGFETVSFQKEWILSVRFDSATKKVSLYSGLDRMEYGQSNQVYGLEMEFDELTKTGIATLNDQGSMNGRAIYHKWTFYKVGPGQRERTDEYLGRVDSNLTLKATARMRFK